MKFITIIVSLMLLSACAVNKPQAENFPKTNQKKLMAAQHWNLVAQDAVEQTRTVLAKKGFADDTPLYILPNTKTPFNHAFRKYLIAHFVESGAVVSTKIEGALEIEFDTQVIEHANGIDPEQYGYATVGVGGFWILRDVFEHLSVGTGLATLGLAGAYDAHRATNPGETNVELLLTTSITHLNRYVMLNADAYYIEKTDARLFAECKGRNRKFCK